MGKKALKPEERKEERINNNKKYNIDELVDFLKIVVFNSSYNLL